MNIIKSFRKNGYVHIKNFFTDEEINIIDNRAKEQLNNKYDFIYLVNKQKIYNSFLNHQKFSKLKESILSVCKNQELKINSLDEFISILSPFLTESNSHQYYLEKFHELFLENHRSNTDVLYDPIYSQIFLKNKVLDVYRELLNTDKIIYYGESHVEYNKPAKPPFKKKTSRGWHPDDWFNYHENTSEFTYNIRGGLWYHSDSECSGGTKFLPGSHFYIRPTKLLKKIIKKILFKKKINNSILNTRLLIPINIFPSKKDFVLWDKRLLHSAWAVKLKKLSKLVLPPFLENFLTSNDNFRFLIEKNSFPRSLANLDFGRQSESLSNYLEAYGRRADYKHYWMDKKLLISNDFMSKLKNKNILFNDKAIKAAQKII
jgi:hypothetical protein